jgi:hypothetical protein
MLLLLLLLLLQQGFRPVCRGKDCTSTLNHGLGGSSQLLTKLGDRSWCDASC